MKVAKLIEILKRFPKDSEIGIIGMFDEDYYLSDDFNIINPIKDVNHLCRVPYSNVKFKECDYYMDIFDIHNIDNDFDVVYYNNDSNIN